MGDPTTPSPGRARRDEGTARAANKKPSKTLTLRLKILQRILQGPATIDDVVPPAEELKRGNYFGSAMLALSRRKLIRQTGERRPSQRERRNAGGGGNPVWEANDVAACRAEAEKLRSELQALGPAATQPTLFPDMPPGISKGGA
ncbi:MAG: hypothetical protein QM703_25460 [Gemmatales bacterium]